MFLFIILIIGWVYSTLLISEKSLLKNKYVANSMLIILLVYVSMIILNSDTFGTDSYIYLNSFINSSKMGLFETIKTSNKEVGFDIFQWLLAQLTKSPQILYFSIWMIFASSLIYLLKTLLNSWQTLFLFLAYLLYFITFSYITNTIRQGLTISMMFIAIASLIKKNNRQFYISILLAPLFHSSAIVISILLLMLYKTTFKLKTFNIIWSILAMTYISGTNQVLSSPFRSLLGDFSVYGSEQARILYGGGTNRLDFFIFSLFFVIYSNYISLKIRDQQFEILTKIYIAFNSLFLIFGFIAFSDRLASYSWFLIPILIFYPLLKDNRKLMGITVMSVFLIIALYNNSFLFFVN